MSYAILEARRQRCARQNAGGGFVPGDGKITRDTRAWRGIKPRVLSRHDTYDEARAVYLALPDINQRYAYIEHSSCKASST